MTARRSKSRMPGIWVEQRGSTWRYRIDAGRDPLTNERLRPGVGGFATEADALKEAIKAKERVAQGLAAHATKIRVRDFFPQWLTAVESNLKATTAQNYRDYITAYIVPTLGDRWLGDLKVTTLNAFYKKLHESGRLKNGDSNARMYAYWHARRTDRDGLGPSASTVAKACDVNLATAKKALARYRRGRTPVAKSQGLEPKTVRNIHVVMNLALQDAVRWGYLPANPAEHAIVPRPKSRSAKKDEAVTWTLEELARWLAVALEDRYSGMWCLVASTGMRRSELAGVERAMLDLEAGTLASEDTRVVVAGRVYESDGKSTAGNRDIALDPFTVKQLRVYVAMIDREREALGDSYPEHDYLMTGPEGRPLHPDTITARFNRLVDRAGVPRIRLHDVRHTYSTLAIDNGQNIKLLSQRIGHADTSVTLKIYTHRTAGADRPVADHMGGLIEAALRAISGPQSPNLSPQSPEERSEALEDLPDPDASEAS